MPIAASHYDNEDAFVSRALIEDERCRHVTGGLLRASPIAAQYTLSSKRPGFAALIGLVMQIDAPAQPPQILQIYREPLKPGSEAAYQVIEQETSRIASALECPHPYLGAESLTGAKEVWWFNGYDSAAEQKQVYDDYVKNTRLMAALEQNSKRKAILTLEPIEVFASYRQDLSAGNPWILGQGRFLVITVTKGDRRSTGTTFEAPDGTRFIVTPAQTRQQADAAHALAGPESNVFAVRPSWSFPAKQWVAADSEFWQPNSPGKRD